MLYQNLSLKGLGMCFRATSPEDSFPYCLTHFSTLCFNVGSLAMLFRET